MPVIFVRVNMGLRLILVLALVLAGASARAQDVNNGNVLVHQICVACHGFPPVGGPETVQGNPSVISGAIQRVPAMMFLGTVLTNAQISDIAAYLLTLSSSPPPPPPPPPPPDPPPSSGTAAKTLGSRATVTPAVTLFGGFELASSSTVYIPVRGNSLGTLGITQSFLDSPRVRLYNSQGEEVLFPGGFTGCSSSNSGGPVVTYYTSVRAQPPHARDACTAQTLAAGGYSFTVTPSTTGAISAPNSGELLFEVTLSPG